MVGMHCYLRAIFLYAGFGLMQTPHDVNSVQSNTYPQAPKINRDRRRFQAENKETNHER